MQLQQNGHTTSQNGLATVEASQALRLIEKLETGTAVVGVVGLGYVGLPLAMEYAAGGFRTLGIDVSARAVERLNAGENYIQDVDDDVLREALDRNRFRAESDYSAAGEADVVFICVPTPVTPHKEPDTTYVESAAGAISDHLRKGQLVVLKSTTYPETTERIVQPILEAAGEARGLTLGEDYFLAFSPERVDPGNRQFTMKNTPVVVGGVTDACTEVAVAALRCIVDNVHCVSSPKAAEMEKLLENIFRSVNIALVNEMARLCDRMGGVNIWEVVEAAATKPFGYMPFFPGPGIGGHCIPIDPYYLSWLARRYDFETSFITLSARINEDMPFYVSEAVMRAVANQPVALKDARILVLGAAFKRDVDDVRHSPAMRIMQALWSNGVTNLAYSDPHVPELSLRVPGRTLELTSVELSPETLQSYDVTVLVTDHSAFPYEMIAEHARVIIDTRNAMEDVPVDPDKRVLLGSGRF